MHARPYGWKRDLPDKRDVKIVHEFKGVLPAHSDLRAQCPVTYDQLQEGSCTANGLVGCHEFDLLKQGLKDFRGSRNFVYWNERALEGTTGHDAGASIRDGAKVMSHLGVCDEKLWPYDVTRFTVRPSKAAFKAALEHRAVSYASVPQSHDALRRTLAGGLPIVFGFSVYESFESDQVARDGVVPMPAPHESILGGHAVMLVGYDDANQRYRVRNSWGASWGDGGYCTMPYAYIEDPDLADDFWVLREVL